MEGAPVKECFDEPCGGDRLQLALVLQAQLPAGVGAQEQQRPDGLRHVHLGGQGHAVGADGARRDVQVHFVHACHRPAAGDRDADATADQAGALVDQVVVGAEQVLGLVVVVSLDHFHEREQVWLELAQSVVEHRAACGPVAVPLPRVEGGYAQVTRAGGVMVWPA
jgi:hypothetical protein